MYNKQEQSIFKQQFWTAFGQYMAPIASSEGAKINWVNYKTGVKDLSFKMEAVSNGTTIRILMSHTDLSKQSMLFNLFKQLKPALHKALQEEWQWAPQTVAENGKTVSSIFTTLSGVSVYLKEDWPLIISFLKPRMIALDAFWNEAKFGFDI